jgi:hypothetical protein
LKDELKGKKEVKHMNETRYKNGKNTWHKLQICPQEKITKLSRKLVVLDLLIYSFMFL